MKPSLSFLRPEGFVALLTGALAILLLAGCSTPVALADSRKPAAPITAPSLSGRLVTRTAAPIATTAELQQCLDSGLPAFGLTLENTNVRVGPSTDFCRVGKIASGAVVEIIDYVMITETKAVAAPAAPIASGPTIGYNEDIKPLFERSCSACHNAIAKTLGLQTTTYRTLMAGSQNGRVVVPGDPDASKLWEMVSQGKMPATGPLPLNEQVLVRAWIEQGAAERRAPVARAAAPANTTSAWYALSNVTLAEVAEPCENVTPGADYLVSADLIRPLTCGLAPTGDVRQVAARSSTASANAAPAADAQAAAAPVNEVAAAAPAPANVRAVNATQTGIQAAALGLPAPSDDDPYLTPAGFCIERRLADNNRGITAIAFAPDGRMFLALDSDLAHDVDPLILYDAFHPSRSIAVYDYVNDMTPVEIMTESSRITGLDYADGALYVSRAGEVGRIPDGGSYETLAGGFKVQSQLFHANNGIEVDGGWVYVSAGGMRDGYVEGPIVGVGEAGAQDIVSEGSPFAARILRAPLSTLLSSRTIGAFTTAARGVRNPYGIAADPSGRIWFTDNGATNVPDEISAGDEVNMLNPGAIGAGEEGTPYFGFPLALSGTPPDWYSAPVAALVNSAAPTGITWANGTVYFGVYGRNPGLYRLGRTASGAIVAERVMMAWPVLAVETAPDGAIWVGMGNGNLFRMTPGC